LPISGDLGGAAGLFLGASLLTIVELIYYFGSEVLSKGIMHRSKDEPAKEAKDPTEKLPDEFKAGIENPVFTLSL
jgi:hypothetical protein